ncbi:RNA methyltransferase [Candidatus Uhrbacteria bacterium]|nr:RNA methyltransferase [Candidatus Uhrbacteria bacterium]
MTPERRKKMEAVLAKRQPTLHVVLENVDDPHNVGAILRSCDAFGVIDVHLLYPKGKMPRMREIKSKSAASAAKWLRFTKWDSPKQLVAFFKKQKIAIVATHMSAKAKDPAKIDLARPVALVLGNEHEGVSKEMLKAADANVLLPMVGFIQSFNVSVAAALLLYEAYRQREGKGMYGEGQLKQAEMKKMMKGWSA